ncbi:hypothetical protein [Nonomuraea jabiensis]|uniref:Uncharacterized protein n=1 Tax=Nonomuraea jabiensis TaxID=882448 RepID=A0A7W9GDB5_9ACTN|nr:hypothetical protein [Nonomuraea jabiensis]MBB5781583.1 hypothetical protein [Nonomuraea jabiensis]
MKIDILDLPAGSVSIADDELDVIVGAMDTEDQWSAYVCTASQRGDCWKD